MLSDVVLYIYAQPRSIHSMFFPAMYLNSLRVPDRFLPPIHFLGVHPPVRYLDPGGEGNVSLQEWQILDQLWKEPPGRSKTWRRRRRKNIPRYYKFNMQQIRENNGCLEESNGKQDVTLRGLKLFSVCPPAHLISQM